MRKDKKANLFLIPIIAIVLIYSFIQTVQNDGKEKQLELEYNYVIGEIIDHKVYGPAESYYVYYKYKVNGIEYSKSVNNSFKYSDCERTRNCIGLKHVVYYDINNPESSFMDFDLTELEMKSENIKLKNIKERIDKLKAE